MNLYSPAHATLHRAVIWNFPTADTQRPHWTAPGHRAWNFPTPKPRRIAARFALLPPGVEAAGYSVVYHAATLSDAERSQAIREGVIRPDMRRTEIIAFKRRIRATAGPRDDGRRAALEAERQRLLARIADIDRELSELA